MIPGITDRSRLPRLAKIRLGETRKSGDKDYPAALDHFSFVDCPEVEAVYGKECRELFPVIFPSDDEEITFPTARKAYGKSGLICACRDGLTATRVVTGKKDEQLEAYCKEHGLTMGEGEMIEMPCPGQDCPWDQQDLCKPLGRLMFLLPQIPRFGFYEICTTSFNSMINVLSVIRSMKSIVGRVAGIPFALKLDEQQVQPQGMKAKIVHVLQLEVRESLAKLVATGRRLAEAGQAPLLPDVVDDTPDDLMPEGGARLEDHLDGKAPAPSRLHDVVADATSEEEPPAEGQPELSGKKISKAQAQQFFKAAHDAGWTDEELKAELEKEGYRASAEIPVELFPVMLKAFSAPHNRQGDPL